MVLLLSNTNDCSVSYLETCYVVVCSYTSKKYIEGETRHKPIGLGFGYMLFNATVNNISVVSWRVVLLVEETGLAAESHPPTASH